MRGLVAGIIVGFLMLGLGGYRLDQLAVQAETIAERVEREEEARRIAICEWAERDRRERREILVGVAEEASPAVIDAIERRFAALEPLPGC